MISFPASKIWPNIALQLPIPGTVPPVNGPVKHIHMRCDAHAKYVFRHIHMYKVIHLIYIS